MNDGGVFRPLVGDDCPELDTGSDAVSQLDPVGSGTSSGGHAYSAFSASVGSTRVARSTGTVIAADVTMIMAATAAVT